MKKLLLVVLTLLLYHTCSFASVLDFNSEGDSLANEVLDNFIKENFEELDSKTVGYYCDIDGDSVPEVVGVVKSYMFYQPEGYKLIILKNEAGKWTLTDNKIYFDLTKKMTIKNSKAEYYKTTLNNSKKCTSKISNKTTDGFKTLAIEKNIKNSQKYHMVSEGTSGVELDLSEIVIPVQKTVTIKYNNLTDRTKHYLEMK